MFIDLNVPIPPITVQGQNNAASKKQKGKQPQERSVPAPAVVFTPAQLTAIETRIDVLVHLGYTVLALNQTVLKKVDPKVHVNVLDALLPLLRPRPGLVVLKRLTIVLDEESEKGFGLTTSNAPLFAPYDILALLPTTAGSFSLACLTHTTPSPLTTHIIALPLTLPRLPFNLKHTLVGTALKNGAVFELPYAGALGGDVGELGGGGGESGAAAKRNWWAAAREVVRVTKGKGVVVTSGAANAADLRAPRDVGNLIAILGLSQDRAHEANTKVPQSLVLRAQTRRTYRAVFSEPTVVIPTPISSTVVPDSQTQSGLVASSSSSDANANANPTEEVSTPHGSGDAAPDGHIAPGILGGKKRARNDEELDAAVPGVHGQTEKGKEQEGSKRKKKKVRSIEGQS